MKEKNSKQQERIWRTYLFFQKMCSRKCVRKDEDENPQEKSRASCKNHLKTTKAAAEGLKKEKMVEGMSDKEECGGFHRGSSGKNRGFVLALGFSK